MSLARKLEKKIYNFQLFKIIKIKSYNSKWDKDGFTSMGHGRCMNIDNESLQLKIYEKVIKIICQLENRDTNSVIKK